MQVQLVSCCGAWALGCKGFNSFGSEALENRFNSRDAQAYSLQGMWDLSWIWDQTHISWIGRWIIFLTTEPPGKPLNSVFLGLLPSSVILPSFRQISYKFWWKWTVFLVLYHTKVEPFGVFDLKEERSLLILSTMSRSPSFPPVLHVPWDYETDTQVHLIWPLPNSSYFSDSYHHYVSDLRILAFFAAQQCLFAVFLSFF